MADLRLRLTPRADRDALVRLEDGVVHARVAAAPVDGKANEALRKLLAKALGVPRSKVAIVRGHTARDKVVRVDGLDDDAAQVRLRKHLCG